MAEMTALEHRIVGIARGHGSLAELCNYIDYDPDRGPVKEHFRPRIEVLRLVEALQLLDEPGSSGGAGLLGAADTAAVHLSHCYQGEYEHTCKYGFDDCPAAPRKVSPQRAPALDLQNVDLGHLLYAVIKRGYRLTHADGLTQGELRQQLEHLMMSYGAQCVEADRALREVRGGKENAQSEVDYRHGLAQKALDKLLGYFPDPQPARAEGASA